MRLRQGLRPAQQWFADNAVTPQTFALLVGRVRYNRTPIARNRKGKPTGRARHRPCQTGRSYRLDNAPFLMSGVVAPFDNWNNVTMGVGILAFGSIADEPGTELAAAVTRRIEVETPFAVEFARSSRTRDGAPTLVPVSEGGAHVPASVLVLDDSVTVAQARAMLYRRETGRRNDLNAGSSSAWIAELAGFATTSVCLYTAFQPNIRPLTAEKLAELAVCSAAAAAGAEHRDGISYLQQQKRRSLVTPLMPAYEKAVLARTGARDLDGAWARARSGAVYDLSCQ